MKITVTFDSLEEFIAAMRPMPGFQDTAAAPSSFERAQEHVQKLAQEATEKDPPRESAQKSQESAQKSQESAQKSQESAQEPTVALTEDFRVEVRRVLANLNKHTGQNTAAELIRAAGYKKLTEVPLEKLPGIMNAAKEALNA